MNECAGFAGCSKAPVVCSCLPFAYLVTHPFEARVDRSPCLDIQSETNLRLMSDSFAVTAITNRELKEDLFTLHSQETGSINANQDIPVPPDNHDKVFTCQFCGKEFSDNRRLNKHIVGHKDHRPYRCNICTKTFKRNYELTAHKKRNNEIKGYDSEACGKAVSSKRALELHKRKHLGAYDFNPLNAELNPICYLLALLGADYFLHVSRIRVKSLTLRLLMSYIYIYIWSTYS